MGTLFVTLSVVFSTVPAQLVRESIDLIVEDYQLSQLTEGTSLKDQVFDNFKSSIIYFAGLILLMAALRGFFLYLTRQTIIVMSRHIEFDMKNDIYKHYQTLPLAFYRSNNTGDLITRISEDVGKVRMYVGPAVMYGANLLVLFILVIAQMISVNPKLTLFSLLPLPLLSIGIYYVSNKMNRQSERIQRSLSSLSTFVQEAFSGVRVIKAFVREEDSANQFLKHSNTYRKESLKLSFINALFFPLILSLIGLSTVFVVYIGGRQVMAGEISVGNIAEFVIYVNMLTWPVTSLGWVTSIVQRAAASQERINEFLETETTIVSKKSIEPQSNTPISFKNVSLTYPDSGIKAIRNMSFDIQPGETLAIVGGTGSGKSTVANLICRMYDPNIGTIYKGEVDLKDLDIESLRNSIGYVPQDSFLFSDTIRNNIAFGSDNLSDEAIEQAAKDADVYHNIMGFPLKFETILGERGITLSGGQKQRLTLARALVREPELLILDDSLSAVDTKTEDKILDNLSRIMKGRSSIIISHRVSSVKLADRILVLDDGEIVEVGTHNELMKKNGAYKSIYDSQTERD